MNYALTVVTLFCISIQASAANLPLVGLQDTITNLSLLKTKAVYKAPNGKSYNVSFEADPQSRVKKMKTVKAKAVANVACDNSNRFDGSYRKVAKTSVATHSATSTSLTKLINRVLAIDNVAINVTTSSPRIEIEDSVVTLVSVYLYAIAREADEDYHIIIGNSSNTNTAKFFNVECSGLPATNNPAFAKIKSARQKVVAFLGGTERCTEGYIKFNDHPKIKIIGSLFYDKEHANNIPGPASSKPLTAWELHPITEFKLL
jgi:ribosomal protein L30E